MSRSSSEEPLRLEYYNDDGTVSETTERNGSVNESIRDESEQEGSVREVSIRGESEIEISDEEGSETDEALEGIEAIPRFEIPASDEYLTSDDSQAFHVVANDDQNEEEIKENINRFAENLIGDTFGYKQIKNYFDSFFSLARINSKASNVDLRLRAFKHLRSGFDAIVKHGSHGILGRILKRLLSSAGQPSVKDIKEATYVANCLLMYIFLLSRLSFHLEGEHMKRLLAAEKKKGARKVELDTQMTKWIEQRALMIEGFTELCELSVVDYSGNVRTGAIKYLWRPPEANKGMVLTFIETIFKFLDNPNCKYADSHRWMEKLFKLVRSICLQFDYSSRMAVALVEKTVNLEYLREGTATKYPFIQPILKVSRNGDMDVLLSHMVHHLGDMVNAEFNQTSTKPYSLLMHTMADLAPDIMIKQLSAILPYLNSDIPQLRNAVLQCFAHLLISENMSDVNCMHYSRLFKLRNRILEFCRNHLQDEAAPVRAKALQVWTTLAEKKKVPISELRKSLISAIGERLLDKSVSVRKNAFTFLTRYLEINPFGHTFVHERLLKELNDKVNERRILKTKDPRHEVDRNSFAEFEEMREQIEVALRAKLQSHLNGTLPIADNTGYETTDLLMTVGSQLTASIEEGIVPIAVAASRGDIPELDIYTAPLDESIEKCVNYACQFFVATKRRYLELDYEKQLQLEERINDYKEELDHISKEISVKIEEIMLAKELSDCIPKALRAVLVGDKGELADAMAFIVLCKKFDLAGSNQAVRQMCSLIWRNNEDSRKAILGIAVQLFVSLNTNDEVKVDSTVDGFMAVLEGMKDEERSSVEEVISNIPISELPKKTAKHVWNICKQEEKRKVALQLLGILAKKDKTLRKYLRKLQAIIKDKDIPSKDRAEALLAIANMRDITKESASSNTAFRIPASDSLFHTVETFVVEEFLRPPDKNGGVWFNVMQNALSIYYDISKDTTTVVSRLAAKLYSIAHRMAGTAEFYTEEYNLKQEEEHREAIEAMKKNCTKMFGLFLERLLVISGEIALRTVIHIDVVWLKEMKKLPELVSQVKDGTLIAKKSPNRVLKDWEFRAAMHKGVFNYSARDDNTNAAHADEERLRAMADNILNNRLFRAGKLLSRMLPLIMYTLRAEKTPNYLRDAASVAFSKFMLVSKELSTKGAPTFFMILNNSQNPVLRHNLVIASGDLCFRMPNLVELYSNNLFSMTKDSETMVRETSILVLTHLLTNQILKQRGSLADVAKLITDPIQEINTLTKEFFIELGTKGSQDTIYNLLPDFISRLSRNSREVSLQQFKIIMSFLLQQISKDKHMDSLVEKLCARYAYIKTDQAVSRNSKISHYYSFCVSQMNLTEKSFIRMRDNLSNFASFMEDQQIYEDFKVPLEKLHKTTKSIDLQTDVTDFLTQLAAINSKGLNGDELARPSKNTTKGIRSGRGRAAKAARELKTQAATRTIRNRKRAAESSEDSETSSIEEE